MNCELCHPLLIALLSYLYGWIYLNTSNSFLLFSLLFIFLPIILIASLLILSSLTSNSFFTIFAVLIYTKNIPIQLLTCPFLPFYCPHPIIYYSYVYIPLHTSYSSFLPSFLPTLLFTCFSSLFSVCIYISPYLFSPHNTHYNRPSCSYTFVPYYTHITHITHSFLCRCSHTILYFFFLRFDNNATRVQVFFFLNRNRNWCDYCSVLSIYCERRWQHEDLYDTAYQNFIFTFLETNLFFR